MSRTQCAALGLVLAGVISAPALASPAPRPSPLSGTPNGAVRAVAMAGSTAYVGGYFRHVGPVTGGFVTVDTGQGLLTRTWPQVTGTVTAVAADGANGWYLAGFFTSVGGEPRANLAHLRADGTLDPGWAPTVNGAPTAIAVFGDRVYIGGTFTAVTGGVARTNLAAFDRTSGAVTDVGSAGGANARVSAFAVRPGGNSIGDPPPRLYVGGAFTQIDAQARGRIASYDAAGTLTGTFAGTGFNAPVNALAEVNVSSNASPVWRLHAGGDFTLFGPVDQRNGLAAFDASDAITSWAPEVPTVTGGPMVRALAAGGGRIYAAGTFGLRAFNRDDGGTAVAWAPNLGFNGAALALAVVGTSVYVGGQLFEVGGTVRRTNAAAFSTEDASVVRAWDPEPSGPGVYALAAGTDGIVLGGGFVAAGGTPRRHLAAFDVPTGRLLPFDPDLDREVSALSIRENTLYAAGAFSVVNGGTPRSRIAAFDLATGAATGFAPNPDGPVGAIAASASTLYAAGTFTQIAGVARNKIAALDVTTGAAGDFQPSFDFYVNTFALRDATVYMGGSFPAMAGEDRRNLAAVRDSPGTLGALTPFDPDPDSFVLGMALDGDRLYAGGQFDAAGTPPTPRSRVAAFDATTGAAVPWDAAVSGLVLGLAKAGDEIIVGGSIATANGQPRSNLAAFATGAGGLSAWAPAVDASVDVLAASPEGGIVAGGAFTSIDGAQTGPLAFFALKPAAPAAPVATAADRSATVVVPPPPAGGAPIEAYAVTASPGGRTATGPAPTLTVGGLDNGTRYTFTATATNRVGTSGASAASNAVTPATPSSPAGAGDTTRPVIRALKLTNRRFRLGARRTARSAASRRGTAFRFTVSEVATTTITVERVLSGRRKGSRCVKPTRALKRRCTRYARAHTLVRRTKASANRVAYSGWVGAKRLAPGSYRATLVATDAAGNRSAPARATFRVVRR
jgi:hypothetical protein